MILHRIMTWISRALAIAGGLVLIAMILLVCTSITGRALNGVLHDLGTGWAQALIDLGLGPVNGDFELVEAGMAFAIFAFLPICQITGSHATVDVFTDRLPDGVLRWLKAVIEVGFAIILYIIAWRLFEGLESKMRSGQTTFLLQFPIWWSYALSFSACAVASVVAIYTAGVRVYEAATGREIIAEGSEH